MKEGKGQCLLYVACKRQTSSSCLWYDRSAFCHPPFTEVLVYLSPGRNRLLIVLFWHPFGALMIQ